MLYLLDANVIITAKDSYYAMEQIPEFWTWLVHLGESGRAKIPEEILDEINPGNETDDAFYKWRKDKDTLAALTFDEEANMADVHPARLNFLAYKHKQTRAVVARDRQPDGTRIVLDCGHGTTIAPHFDAGSTRNLGCIECGEMYVRSAPQYASEFSPAV